MQRKKNMNMMATKKVAFQRARAGGTTVLFDEVCPCEERGNYSWLSNTGFKGILAHVENGMATTKIERCDTCMVYKTDRAAQYTLRKYLPKLLAGDFRTGWWEKKLNLTEAEKVIAKRMLSGIGLVSSPLHLNHPVLKYFAMAVLKGVNKWADK